MAPIWLIICIACWEPCPACFEASSLVSFASFPPGTDGAPGILRQPHLDAAGHQLLGIAEGHRRERLALVLDFLRDRVRQRLRLDDGGLHGAQLARERCRVCGVGLVPADDRGGLACGGQRTCPFPLVGQLHQLSLLLGHVPVIFAASAS